VQQAGRYELLPIYAARSEAQLVRYRQAVLGDADRMADVVGGVALRLREPLAQTRQARIIREGRSEVRGI
jgi:hypothetical protein